MTCTTVKGNNCTLLVGMQINKAVIQSSMDASQKIKIKTSTTVLFSKPSIGYMTKGNELHISKRVLYSCVHCNAFHNS